MYTSLVMWIWCSVFSQAAKNLQKKNALKRRKKGVKLRVSVQNHKLTNKKSPFGVERTYYKSSYRKKIKRALATVETIETIKDKPAESMKIAARC